MTEVAFHTGIDDPLGYACRLLRKASRSGARVAVHAESGLLQELDQLLWTFDPLEFLPHVLLPRDAGRTRVLEQTPLVLVQAGAQAPAECRIAVSIGGPAFDGPERYERVIAIVGTDPAQRDAGRQRWRDYERAGFSVSHVARPA